MAFKKATAGEGRTANRRAGGGRIGTPPDPTDIAGGTADNQGPGNVTKGRDRTDGGRR